MFESYGKSLVSSPWFRESFSFELIKDLSQDVEEVRIYVLNIVI